MPYGLTVTPTGESGIAMFALAEMVAESTTFQDAIGATGDAAAKKAAAGEKIKLAEFRYDDEIIAGYERPFALIVTPGGDRDRAISAGSFAHNGEFDLYLEQDIPAEYRADDEAADAEMFFKNFVDGVIADCQLLSTMPGYLITSTWLQPEGPGRIDVDNVFAYAIRISVSWGLQ